MLLTIHTHTQNLHLGMVVLVARVMGLSAVCKEVIGAQIPMFPQVDILLPQIEFLVCDQK